MMTTRDFILRRSYFCSKHIKECILRRSYFCEKYIKECINKYISILNTHCTIFLKLWSFNNLERILDGHEYQSEYTQNVPITLN